MQRRLSILVMMAALGCSCSAAAPQRQAHRPAAPRAAVVSGPVVGVPPSIDPCRVQIPTSGAVPAELDERAREFLDIECRREGPGAWRLSFQTLRERAPSAETLADDEHAPSIIEGTWALAYVTVDGAVALSEPRALHIDNSQFYEVSRLAVLERFDFDGDGHAELAVHIETAQYEATPTGAVELFTFSGDLVQAYPPAAVPARIDAVRDIDGDGRPDLVSREPYFVMTPFGIDGQPAGGPLHVYRSVNDGRFSDADPEALALLRSACPEAPTRILRSGASIEEAYERGGLAVSCARIWGRSAAQIVEAVRAELEDGCREARPHYSCAQLADTLIEHARRLDPPQTLR